MFLGIGMLNSIALLSMMFFLGCADEFTEAPPEPKRSQIVETKKTSEVSPPQTCDTQDVELVSKNSAFSAHWRSCSRKTWGSYESTKNCIRQSFSELRSSCASCFAAFTACGKASCSWWTCKTDNPDCDKCGWGNCGAALEKCLGFSRTNLYEYQ